MQTLADKLDAIALNQTFDTQALYNARQHPVVTSNDRQVLFRFDYGAQLGTDHIHLQEIANYIREYDNANKQ